LTIAADALDPNEGEVAPLARGMSLPTMVILPLRR
jgi:hypothetical protein